MKPPSQEPVADASAEISALIETLVVTEQRLEELTSGEVDTVAGRDGRTFLLRRAQEHWRHSEAAKQAAMLSELRVLFDMVPAMIWLKDTKNGFVRVNKRVAETTGLSVEEIEGKSAYEIFPQEAAAYYADDLEIIRSGVPKLGIIEKLPGPQDQELWVQTDKVPVCDKDGMVTGLIAMVHDITEHKRSEAVVRETSALLQALLENTTDDIYFKDLQSRFIHFSRKMIAGFHLTGPHELVGRTDFDFYAEEHARPAFETEQEIIRTGKAVINVEEKEIRRDGRVSWVLSSKMPWRDNVGNVIGTMGISRDITERKRADESLKRLAAIVESSADAIISKTLDGIITSWNPAAEKMFGYATAEIIGQSMLVLVPPDRTHEEVEILAGFANGEQVRHFETVRLRKGGERFDVSATISPIKDVEGNIIGVSKIVRDITELKKLEQQFRQVQKMESFGQLAGGVAHDFNNILAVIQIQAALLMEGSRLAPEQLKFANEIVFSVERAASLTRQLLLFSRKETLQLRDLDLNQSINGMTIMLRRILGEHIKVQFKFSLEPLGIHADAGMMDQVLMNLAVNSRDAMSAGGLLTIQTSVVTISQPVVSQSTQARPGEFVCLSVTDNGSGIAPENLPRIFEPFFTTKEVGKGTGLGLATLFGIVQQHKGWVTVESELGIGTTFRIYLPRLASISQAPLVPVQPKLNTLPGGTETILYVEDDDFLRPCICDTLTRLGYCVISASNGVKALEMWEQHSDEIQLLLTDLVMPGGITGKQLGAQLLIKNPKLKVVYASGYSTEVAGVDFPLKEGVNFLTKPFHAQKLAETVRKSLDQPIAG